jgi:uncharacterized protein YjeT (DUF2065 family)
MTLHDLLTGLALVVVIEGMVYALFPSGLKSMMAQMQSIPTDTLRIIGLTVAAVGVAALWLIRA